MESKEISVVIPAYNASSHISETIESILRQSSPVGEIIVIDDGSTDNTCEILDKYNESIRLIKKENGGVSSARNLGIREAKGSWLAFVDSDDVWHPDKISLQVSALNLNENCILVYSGFKAWSPDEAGKYIEPKELFVYKPSLKIDENLSGWIYHLMLLTNYVLTSSCLVKKSSVCDVGLFDESLPVAEDWKLFIKLSRQGEFIKIDSPLVLYRQTHSSLTKSLSSKDYASELIDSFIDKYGYENHIGQRAKSLDLSKRRFQTRFNYGYLAMKLGLYRKAFLSIFKAVCHYPFYFNAWVLLVFCFFRILTGLGGKLN